LASAKFLRSGGQVKTVGKISWNEASGDKAGGRNFIVTLAEGLANLNTTLLLHLATSEKLDLESTDSGLDISRNAGFKIRSESLLNLVLEILDLVINKLATFQGNTSVLLAFVLGLEL